MRLADQSDLPALVELMREFYAESGFPLETERARAAFSAVLADPRLGRVWLVEQGGTVAGYVVVTAGFAMEYGGTVGVVDDLFLRPAFRGHGLGTAVLAEVRRACDEFGLRALRVEVGRDNPAAQAMYRSAGLAAVDHQLMTLRLSSPLHEAGSAGANADGARPASEREHDG